MTHIEMVTTNQYTNRPRPITIDVIESSIHTSNNVLKYSNGYINDIFILHPVYVPALCNIPILVKLCPKHLVFCLSVIEIVLKTDILYNSLAKQN